MGDQCVLQVACSVRVVAGVARGRSLRAPAGRGTRPTSDRVREAMFDMVGAAMDLEGAVVVDLFAGTGALGIEALSRGAKHATFVETGRAALAAINANLAMLALGPERATVVIGDALRWATAADGVASADLVLADPPYAFDRWSDLLASLAGWAGLVVIESGTPIGLGDRWTRVRERRYGATVVTIAGPVPSGAAPAEPQVAP